MTQASTTALALCSLLLITLSASACTSEPTSSGTFHPAGEATPLTATGTPGATGPAAGSTPTLPPAEIDAIALRRYRDFQAAYQQAYATGDASVLSGVVMDPLLGIITKDVETETSKGVLWRFNNILNPKVGSKSKDGTAVLIVDCLATLQATKVMVETGKVVQAKRLGAHLYQARLLWDGTTWTTAEARKGKPC
ncbi:hypothetical protein GCM10027589_05860 [Actinocorallia lasiicapitis]